MYIDKLIHQEWISKIPDEILDMDVNEFLSSNALNQYDLPLKYKEINDLENTCI